MWVRDMARRYHQRLNEIRARTEPPHVPGTARDVYETFFVLRHFLPSELARVALRHADYCVVQSARRDDLVDLATYDSEVSRGVFLCSAPVIAFTSGRAMSVHKVKLIVKSRDHGQVSDASAGSWSWWEVAVAAPASILNGLTPKPVPRFDEEADDGQRGVVCLGSAGYKFRNEGQTEYYASACWDAGTNVIVNEEPGLIVWGPEQNGRALRGDVERELLLTSRRLLVNNELCGSNWKTHEIELRADAEDVQERRWVKSLTTGDRVALMACCRFHGWHNFIEMARIEIHYPILG